MKLNARQAHYAADEAVTKLPPREVRERSEDMLAQLVADGGSKRPPIRRVR